MSDIWGDRYWQSEFTVTEADIQRLENYILETNQAYDLTALAERIIRGRLLYGSEISPAAIGTQTSISNRLVRLWNPLENWQIGDYAVVAVKITRDNYKPYVGEVVAIEGSNVKVRVDALELIKTYSTSDRQENLTRWRQFVKELVEVRRAPGDLNATIERILLEYGDLVGNQLYNALSTDERFIRLSGRWFLRRLAVLPASEQLHALAWAILNLAEPQPTEALLPLLPPPLTSGDPGLFGLYLALRNQPQLFANADPGQRPRWKLIAPPTRPDPGSLCCL